MAHEHLPHGIAIQLCTDFDEASSKCSDPNHPDSERCPCRQLIDAIKAAKEAAFDEGWKMASQWGHRQDLVSDMDSPAYLRERAERIS